MNKQYTRSEVATTGNKDNALIILHDNVYDVTKFLNEHPGGEEVLLDHVGKDGSEDFNDVGHSVDALSLMKTYKVGELVQTERTNQQPKHWNTNYAKKDNTQDQGVNPVLMGAAVVVLLAIVYFVYL